MLRRYMSVGVAITALCAGPAIRAVAQVPAPPPTLTPPRPADALFNDTVLHEIRLAINSRDWLSLKSHYMENTYYPCDVRWGPLVVRNVGMRSRGTGSRSGVKPGLRVDFDR